MALFHSVTFPLSCRDASRQHVLSYIHPEAILPRSTTTGQQCKMYNALFLHLFDMYILHQIITSLQERFSHILGPYCSLKSPLFLL